MLERAERYDLRARIAHFDATEVGLDRLGEVEDDRCRCCGNRRAHPRVSVVEESVCRGAARVDEQHGCQAQQGGGNTNDLHAATPELRTVASGWLERCRR